MRSRMSFKKKPCRFTEAGIFYIDYKDEKLLQRYVTEEGKIIPRRVNGSTAWHQRQLIIAIKRARHMGLLPFVQDNPR